jgi:ATP-dependent Clp protease ATP-binding subunit ClpA
MGRPIRVSTAIAPNDLPCRIRAARNPAPIDVAPMSTVLYCRRFFFVICDSLNDASAFARLRAFHVKLVKQRLSSRIPVSGGKRGMGKTTKRLDPAQTGREAQKLEAGLRARIVGQDEAIRCVVESYQTLLAGMCSPGRPIANFLFLGPTGSGKTRMVEVTAETLLGDPRAVVKIDCGEFQHSHEIAKLMGSPPGYLGHRETHSVLSQEVLNRYHTETLKLSFVLFDEIEKASDAVWNLLLGILDRATLVLGDNSRVDFSRVMIFMTSNLGATEMSTILRPRLGFTLEAPKDAPVETRLKDQIGRAGVEAARRKFSPEFMNRIDRMVVFQPLGTDELRRILSIELDAVQRRIIGTGNSQPFLFKVTEAGREFLLRDGVDLKYGARHLKRSIERHVVYPLSNLIATEQVKRGDMVLVDYDEELGILVFSKETSWAAASKLADWLSPEPPTAPGNARTAAEPPRWFERMHVKR